MHKQLLTLALLVTIIPYSKAMSHVEPYPRGDETSRGGIRVRFIKKNQITEAPHKIRTYGGTPAQSAYPQEAEATEHLSRRPGSAKPSRTKHIATPVTKEQPQEERALQLLASLDAFCKQTFRTISPLQIPGITLNNVSIVETDPNAPTTCCFKLVYDVSIDLKRASKNTECKNPIVLRQTYEEDVLHQLVGLLTKSISALIRRKEVAELFPQGIPVFIQYDLF